MKKTLCILVIIVCAFALVSCGDLLSLLLGDMEQYTIRQRLDSFVSKLNNGEWSSIYLDMHPEASSYEQSKEGTFWSSLFPNDNYEIQYLDPTTGTEPVMTTTMTYDLNDSSASDYITITFKEDGEANWKIYKIERNGNELFRRLGL